MTNSRDKLRARRNARWAIQSREQVRKARKNIGLDADQYIPDEVLALEADHYLPRSNPTGSLHHQIESHEQWAGFRLIGIADTEEGRNRLAERLSPFYSVNPNCLGGSSKVRRRSGDRHDKKFRS